MTMERTAPGFWIPALIGGAGFGVLSGLPVVSCGCCAFALGAGFLGAFLYSKECRKVDFPFNAAGGAKIGLIAGVAHGIVQWIIGTVVNRLMGSEQALEDAIAQIESNPDIPPETADLIIRGVEFMSGAGAVIVFLAIGIVFALIGGLIGGAIFKVEPATPAEPAA
jgi:hypothetical protein